MPAFKLTREERFLWHCARFWRDPTPIQKNWPPLKWERVWQITQANKMQMLLYTVVTAVGKLDTLPPEIAAELTEGAQKFEKLAEAYAAPLADYLARADAQNIPTVVLKGLSIGHNFYQNPAMRPGGDIDLLARKEHLHPSLHILDEMGNYRWHKLLDDRYYERHHLHQTRGRLDTRIWFEVHWALDHPYTLLTIDYEAMMDRAKPGTLLGQPVYELSPPDQLLSQVVHLVKHAVYLPDTAERPDIQRVILADGMLMYFLDIVETLNHYGDSLDWDETLYLAHEWGAADMLAAVLRVCKDFFYVRVPRIIMAQLPLHSPTGLRPLAMTRLVEYETALHLGRKPSRFWGFMVGYQESLVLRPIRLLDAFAYLFPPAHFLERQYGRATLPTRLGHTLAATGKYLHNIYDSIYFTWDYHRRLKKEDIAHGFIQPNEA